MVISCQDHFFELDTYRILLNKQQRITANCNNCVIRGVVYRVNKPLDLSVAGYQWPIGLPASSISLPKWFCSTTKSFAVECKINVKLITAIQNVPVRNNFRLKGYRTKHLQTNARQRPAWIIAVDGELESKSIDFFLHCLCYITVISSGLVPWQAMLLERIIPSTRTEHYVNQVAQCENTRLNITPQISTQPLCHHFAPKWRSMFKKTKRKQKLWPQNKSNGLISHFRRHEGFFFFTLPPNESTGTHMLLNAS